MLIKIKPLSVNKCWQGRRFKTKMYKEYEKELLKKLNKMKIPDGIIGIDIEVGFKSKLSDLDNILKPFLDILQKKYGFNDRNIYQINIEKRINKDEYIEFDIYKLNF